MFDELLMFMLQEEQKITGVLLFSVFVAVIGNSFLYGYNIGVVNTPSLVGGLLPILACCNVVCLFLTIKFKDETENKLHSGMRACVCPVCVCMRACA